MTYNTNSKWETKKLKDIVIVNPAEEIEKGSAVKRINLDKLDPNSKVINGFEEIEYTGKGSKFRNLDVLVPQISSALLASKTALVTTLDENEVAVGSNWYIVMRSIRGITEPNFLYYMATTPWFKELAVKSLEGSTHSQYINLSALMESSFSIPPYDEQYRIAETLSAIDSKIEQNQKVCQVTEKVLNRLFCDWFIEYNFPDEHGAPYRKNGGSLVTSDLGLIPTGWKTGNLSDIGNIVAGGTPSKKVDTYYSADGIAWITPRDLSRLKTKFIQKGAIDITGEGFDNCSASLLPQGTVLFSSRAPIGYIAIAANELTTNQGFRSIIPFPHIGSTFVYYLLLSKIQNITNMASGTTFKEISGQTLKKLKIVIPDVSVLQIFTAQTDSLMHYQANLEKENRLLASTRANLLPLLMSGTLKIPVKRSNTNG